MDGHEVRITMKAKAMSEARDGELIRSFLMDLEHEYSRAHRLAFQAHWGLGGRDLDVPDGPVLALIDQGLMYARKWFGVEAVHEVVHAAASTRSMTRAA